MACINCEKKNKKKREEKKGLERNLGVEQIKREKEKRKKKKKIQDNSFWPLMEQNSPSTSKI